VYHRSGSWNKHIGCIATQTEPDVAFQYILLMLH